MVEHHRVWPRRISYSEPGEPSVSKTTVAREPDGAFLVQVGSADEGANWIPLEPGRFSLS